MSLFDKFYRFLCVTAWKQSPRIIKHKKALTESQSESCVIKTGKTLISPHLLKKSIIGFLKAGRLLRMLSITKNNIDIDNEFKTPVDSVLASDYKYSDLIQYGNREDMANIMNGEYSGGISYIDAAYVLQYNTEYPVSRLNKDQLDSTVESNYRREILDSSEISIKYKGYIQREQQMADKIMRLENLAIPEGFDFDKVESLSIECRQKLKKYSPRTIAQASRISGISPADISVLLVYFGR